MKKLNLSLIVGIVLVLLLIIIVGFGDKITKIDPYALKIGEFKEIDGKLTYDKPPHPPNDTYIFGTDILGRDIFSRIIHGAKITLKLALVATLFRFIVATPMAFFGGFGNKATSTTIRYFSTIFSSIPALIISIIILKNPIFIELDLNTSIAVFAMVLTFVEWGRLAKILENNVKDILNMNFINGEIAIGKNDIQIALQNVVPHIIAPIIILFFMEIGRSLVLIAQLGVFGVYIGGNKLNMRMIADMNLGIVPEYYPEWGGMLAASRYAINIKKPWIVLYTVGAFFTTVLGFNMLGEGLKAEVNKRDSMVLTYTKRILNHLNPRTYIYEIKNIKKYKNNVSLKTIILALILVILSLPEPKSMFELNSEDIFSHIEEFEKDEYDGRLVGTSGRDKATEYIVKNLENSNIKPLFGNKYIDEFEVKSNFADLKSSRLYIQDNYGKELINFEFRKNYAYKDMILSKEETTATIIIFSEFEKGNYNKDKRYFIVVDEEVTTEDMYLFSSKGRKLHIAAKNDNVEGILFPIENFNGSKYKKLYDIKDYDFYHNTSKKRYTDAYFIPVDKGTGNKIIENEGNEIVLENKFNENERIGFNIGGIIPAIEETDENIMIVTNYDYIGYESELKFKGLLYNSTSLSVSLEMLNKLANSEANPNKNIIFLYLDSSKIDLQGAKKFIAKHRNTLGRNTFIIGMNFLGLDESDKLYLDNSSIPSDNQKFQDYISYIKKRANESNLELEQSILVNKLDDVYELIRRTDGSGILIKSISQSEILKYYNTRQNDITLIDENKLRNQAQLILDLVTHIAY